MKIRAGFVSNSSSSSFVVAFPKQPESAQDVLEMLFPGQKPDDIISIYDYSKTCKEIADRVWVDVRKQIKKKSKMDLKELIEIFKYRYYYLEGNSIDWDVLEEEGRIVHIPKCRSCKEFYFGTVDKQLEEVLK